MLSTKLQTPGARSAALAAARPDEIALICEYEDGHSAALSRNEPDRWANALAPKRPRSFEIVARLPRDEAGKLRRSSLRDERGG